MRFLSGLVLRGLENLRVATDQMVWLMCRGVFGSPDSCMPQLLWDTIPASDATPHLKQESSSLLDWDGLLWAVPKSRRSLERRLTRRYGAENWPNGRKLIRKQQLFFCFGCGTDKVAGKICLTCFEKVMAETRIIQKEINAKLGYEPRNQEVELFYADDERSPDDMDKNKKIIEIERKRPAWFTKNLLQRVNVPATTTTEVNPSDLG